MIFLSHQTISSVKNGNLMLTLFTKLDNQQPTQMDTIHIMAFPFQLMKHEIQADYPPTTD